MRLSQLRNKLVKTQSRSELGSETHSRNCCNCAAITDINMLSITVLIRFLTSIQKRQ